MQITVNGQSKVITIAILADFLEDFGIIDQRIAVELNGKIVAKSDFYTTSLSHGDVLEIVHAIGGG